MPYLRNSNITSVLNLKHALSLSYCDRVAGIAHQEHRSPASVQIRQGQSPTASTPGLTPELRQLINADVDVRRAASLDNVCDSSDIDSGDRFHVSAPSLQSRLPSG